MIAINLIKNTKGKLQTNYKVKQTNDKVKETKKTVAVKKIKKIKAVKMPKTCALTCVTVAITLLSTQSLAVQQPIKLAADGRLEVVAYAPNNVVPILGSTFVTTQILFGKDESIEMVQTGDLGAWTASISKTLPNMMFIKPTAYGSNTNMTVVTNKHTYYFHLQSNQRNQQVSKQMGQGNEESKEIHKIRAAQEIQEDKEDQENQSHQSNKQNKKGQKNQRNQKNKEKQENQSNQQKLINLSSSTYRQPTYAIRFIYPQAQQQRLRQDRNYRQQQQHALLSAFNNPKRYNWDYSFHGNRTIVPLHVFDDGQFTYMQLQPHQPIPAVFAVNNPQGKESVVNTRQAGQYLVIQRVAPQFTLRVGKSEVASIFNNKQIAKLRHHAI